MTRSRCCICNQQHLAYFASGARIFVKKVKKKFFSETPKNHVFEKEKILSPFWRKSQRALENFRQSEKLFFFLKRPKKSCFQKKYFSTFLTKIFSPNARWDSENFRQKSKSFFWKHDFWAFQKKIILYFFDHMYSTCQTPLAPRGAPLTPHGSPLTLHESYQTYPGSPTNAHGWNPIYILFSFCMSIGRHPMNRL